MKYYVILLRRTLVIFFWDGHGLILKHSILMNVPFIWGMRDLKWSWNLWHKDNPLRINIGWRKKYKLQKEGKLKKTKRKCPSLGTRHRTGTPTACQSPLPAHETPNKLMTAHIALRHGRSQPLVYGPQQSLVAAYSKSCGRVLNQSHACHMHYARHPP